MTRRSGAHVNDRQRLFLGSAGLGALPSWLSSISMTPERAVLVATAANPLPSAPFVDAAAHLLQGEGMTVDRLDLEHAQEAKVEQALQRARLVFVTGGYAMFLLQHVYRTGFDRIVPPAVRSGYLAYAGISAETALASIGSVNRWCAAARPVLPSGCPGSRLVRSFLRPGARS
jgi:dipeptidase E